MVLSLYIIQSSLKSSTSFICLLSSFFFFERIFTSSWCQYRDDDEIPLFPRTSSSLLCVAGKGFSPACMLDHRDIASQYRQAKSSFTPTFFNRRRWRKFLNRENLLYMLFIVIKCFWKQLFFTLLWMIHTRQRQQTKVGCAERCYSNSCCFVCSAAAQ